MKTKLLLTILTLCSGLSLLGQIPNYIPQNGLVAWYPFNGNANDESGNGNNLNNYRSVLTYDRNGDSNSAYKFMFTPNTVNWGSYSFLYGNINTNSILNGLTISIWLKTENLSQYGNFLDFGYNEFDVPLSGDSEWFVYQYGQDSHSSFGSITSSNFNANSNINPLVENDWTQLIYTNENGIAKFYQNGSLINTLPSQGNPILNENVTIGMKNHSLNDTLICICPNGTVPPPPPPGYPNFKGDLDDIGIWSRALTQQEITSLYSGLAPCQNTSSVNSASITQGESYSFNGQNLTTAGTYNATLQNAAGCDSLVTLNLTVEPLNCEITASDLETCLGGNITLTLASASNPLNTIANYQIGDVTPSGGIVFYDKGNESNGWRYLEVMPVDYSGPTFYTGCYCTSIEGTSNSLGSGYENSQIWASTNCSTVPFNYSYGGYTGWYLPSVAELTQIYNQLNVNNLYDFSSGGYWSSNPAAYGSCGINGGASVLNFNNGSVYSEYRSGYQGSGYARLVRRFVAEPINTILWSTGETTPSISVTPTETTTYSVTLTQGTQTCTSDVTITVNQPINETINASITEGETYSFNGQNLTSAGTYTATLQNAAGCDSVLTLNLIVELAVEPLSCQITAIESSVCIGETAVLNLTSNPTNTIPSYQIGDVTPSGGIVFYDKGNVSDGWRYLEVMPLDYSGPTYYSGCYCTSILGTTNSLGSGYENSQIWSTNPCSLVPFNINYGGYSGWYLPSGAELNEIYQKLKITGITSFADGGYWSSNPAPYGSCGIDGGNAVVNFVNGQLYGEYRPGYSGSGYARLVRRFIAEPINTILWSTGETTPSISVSPSATTTYSVTVTKGTQTCTSDVTITVNQQSATTETVSACGSYTWKDNTYTQSGTYTWTGSNAAGCDSVITLNLTITPQPTQPPTACYQTTTFNNQTCSWDVTGTQPPQPATACYQTATFNTQTCSWVLTGTPGNANLPSNLQQGLVGYWPFNGNANDVSGNSFNANVLGCTLTNDRNGNTSSAYDFNGNGQYMTIPGIPSISGAAAATFSCWVKVDGANTNTNCSLGCSQFLIARDPDFSTQSFYLAYGQGNQKFGGAVSNYYGVLSSQTFSNPFSSWVHVTWSIGEGAIKMYLNGQLSNSSNYNGIIPVSNGNLYFGFNPVGGFPYYLNGQMDDIAIWNRVLTASEIQLLHSQNGNTTEPPATACYETATFNNQTCSWDVTGSPAPAIVTNASACGSYTWDVNGQAYSTSGEYNFNSNCQDYTLNLTVNQPTSETVNASITEGETYSFNGQNLTTAGTYTTTLQNAAGCDSLATLNLTIEPAVEPLNCLIVSNLNQICRDEDVTLSTSNVADPINLEVGGRGPAGGLIFYDKGFESDGWRYLEAAPEDLSVFPILGCYGSASTITSTAVGRGLANTVAISNSCSGNEYAANVCLNYVLNGFDDWFLPSLGDLNQIYNNLHLNGLGDYANNTGPNYSVQLYNRYWSSSQVGSGNIYNSWAFDFGVNGTSGPYNQVVGRNEPNRIRPVRYVSESAELVSSFNILWSTGETTPSISVSPTETTTYSVTVTQGTQTCTSDVTITVNQPTSETVNASITEGETYSFNGQNLTTAGTYSATLQNAAGCDSIVTLNLTVTPAPVAGCYASSVVNFNQGPNVLGSAVSSIRSNANQALGQPEAVVTNVVNFVSLGFGGTITVAFETPIANGAGNDIRLDEATWGNNPCSRYPEKADVFASQDGTNFIYLGQACQDASFDLGTLSWAKYIRLVDVSDILSFNNDADGFDLNGIECLNGSATNPSNDGLEACTLQEIVNYAPGTRKNGTAVPSPRNNANNALGMPQSNNTVNFVALGFGGSLVAKFDYVVFNQPGNDLQVTETSFGNPSCTNYPEKARVSLSLDNQNWVEFGEICQDGAIDMGTMPYAQYIRIQDATPISSSKFNGAADGYDVDAVVVLNNGCGTSSARLSQLDNTTTPDEALIISAFPNPMEDYTIVNFEGLESDSDFNFQIMDASGRLVRNENIRVSANNPTYMFNASELARGIYQVVLSNEKGNQIIRLVK